MRFRCRVCEAVFHETDQNRTQQKNQECPVCGHNDIHEETKLCPTMKELCVEKRCATWNDYFGMCGMAVPAFLNAREEERIRTEEAERKAYHEQYGRSIG